MAVWSHKTWTSSGKEKGVIDPWDDLCVKDAEYMLSAGSEYFINSERQSAVKLKDGECFSIAPGQFVFILTGETIKMPKDCMALISARATTKFRGLVNVSGFRAETGIGHDQAALHISVRSDGCRFCHGGVLFRAGNQGPFCGHCEL
ncbi:MAG: hypothetical protein GDA53_05550 [Rhodobacteraceae bacterium]|nr:hypothetical protein [Paracoccaceae bacterium]